jgi:hypothetical protein
MKLPFSRSDFFLVFEHYNESVWPAQAFLYLLALMSVLLAFRNGRDASRGVLIILAVLWMWMGVVYHAVFFAAINPVATLVGAVFVAQGLVFVFLSMRSDPIVFIPSNTPDGWIGALLIVTGLVVYPILSSASGHEYPAQPTFGLPCPTTIFTIGMLVWALKEIPKWALIVPVLWTAVGTSAALQLGVVEDLLLAAATIALVAALALQRSKRHAEAVA